MGIGKGHAGWKGRSHELNLHFFLIFALFFIVGGGYKMLRLQR